MAYTASGEAGSYPETARWWEAMQATERQIGAEGSWVAVRDRETIGVLAAVLQLFGNRRGK